MNKKVNFPDLSTPVVMGILNVTPDSFYDGGQYKSETELLEHAAGMIADGAAIIDIGGLSTRPGSKAIGEQEEWNRIAALLKTLRREFPGICLSVDTYRSSVAQKAIENGADMINDISGATFDPLMPEVIGRHNIPFVIMHIQGRPGNMQDKPVYEDVIQDIHDFFTDRIKILKAHGAGNFILDPGFGFGKTLEHNYTLLKGLKHFLQAGYPLLAGISRKSMINKVLGTSPSEALNGTTVLNTIALLRGASILRVHDVKEANEAIKLIGQLNKEA